MRTAMVLVLLSVLFVAACGADEDDAADTSTTSTTARRGEQIVIRERVVIAALPGAEPIATGQVLEGSTLGGAPFCVGGTIRDSHGSTDPAVRLILETITCPDGSVRLRFTPDEPQGPTQTGAWTIVSGTGAFEGLRGSGGMDVAYDPDPDSPAHVTFTGTVTREKSR